MQRHIFLIPGFFGFANLGDFTYWGHVKRKLSEWLEGAGIAAEIHSVKSLPTASLRTRTRNLLETIADVRPPKNAALYLIGHSTGGLDARLLLTPAVDLNTDIDPEPYAARVRATVSVATPHRGAPIATVFTSILGRQLLRTLSVMTIATLRRGRLPLSVWARGAGLFAMPESFNVAAGTLAAQIYRQVLADFNEDRRNQVEDLLQEVERDQSLLTQLTVESLDLFNAAAGDRDGVLYGSVVTCARRPDLTGYLDAGFDPVDQAQHALYHSLARLSSSHALQELSLEHQDALREGFGELPEQIDNDGIVPTLSQPWGRCVAMARADHLDIIGHFRDEHDALHPYDWLTTRSDFRSQEFHDVWQRVAEFLAEAG
jgi:triacylglycerol lipase